MPPNDSDGSKTPWQTWAVVTILVAAIPVVPKIIELWHPAPTPTPSPSPSANSIDPLSGVWDQYAVDNYGNLQYIGKTLVTKHNGSYVMAPKEQAQRSNSSNASSIFDITYNQVFWTFRMELLDGRLLSFKLQKVSDTSFEGSSYFNGQFPQRNRWIKVE